MSNDKPQELMLTLPLKQFVNSHLGSGYWHSRTIDDSLARIIYELTKNHPDSGVYIQWADEHSPELNEPVLWNYGAWKAECESWLRAKSQSEARTEEWDRNKANVRMVAKAIQRHLEALTIDQASVIAHQWINTKKWAKIKAVGINKLIEKGDKY